MSVKFELVSELLQELEIITETDFEDISVSEDDGEILVKVNDAEYKILTQDQVYDWMNGHVEQTAAYFNAEFLANMTELPEEVFTALAKTEAHEAVLKLIENTCGITEFIDQAIEDDGVGHFLNSYDGTSYELQAGDYIAFQVG